MAKSTCADCGYMRPSLQPELMHEMGKCDLHGEGGWMALQSPVCPDFTLQTREQRAFANRLVVFLFFSLMFGPVFLMALAFFVFRSAEAAYVIISFGLPFWAIGVGAYLYFRLRRREEHPRL